MTENQVVGEQPWSSKYDRPGAEEVVNMKTTTV